MREHLVKCIVNEIVHLFPKQDSTKRVLNAKKPSCYSVFVVHVAQYANI